MKRTKRPAKNIKIRRKKDGKYKQLRSWSSLRNFLSDRGHEPGWITNFVFYLKKHKKIQTRNLIITFD